MRAGDRVLAWGTLAVNVHLLSGLFRVRPGSGAGGASAHTHSILMTSWWHGLGWAVQPLDGRLGVLRCPEGVLKLGGGVAAFFRAYGLGYGLGVKCAEVLGYKYQRCLFLRPMLILGYHKISRCWASFMRENELQMVT